MINLLPPRYKQEVRQEENYRLVLILGTTFLIFLISLVLILFSIKTYIQGQAESLKFLAGIEEEKLQIAQNRELQEKIIESGQKISKLESFYKNNIYSIEALEKIFQILPEKIYLTSLSFNKGTGVVSFSGFSPSREILFELRNDLQKQEWISEINFPPQNWIKPTNIDFQVIFKVNPNGY